MIFLSITTTTKLIEMFYNPNILFAITVTYFHLFVCFLLHYCVPVIYLWLYIVCVHNVVTYICTVLCL
jgi:hypothetical protein